MSATAWQQQGWGVPPVPPQMPGPQMPVQQWSSPTHPGPRTNLLAMLAIGSAAAGTTILLGLGSIAAIVLGCIALAQIRRTGEDGRLLAIWAIILGAVTLVALVAAAVGIVAMIVTIAEQAQAIVGS
ncbi:MAG: DUF4190 domain-containing protein [Actinomycetota bacterium]